MSELAAATAGSAVRGRRDLQSIQILRAVAAGGVLVYHVSHELAERTGLTGFLSDILVGAAGVDLFFVISGFVMVYASEALFGQPGGAALFLPAASGAHRPALLGDHDRDHCSPTCGPRTARCRRAIDSRQASSRRSCFSRSRAPTASWARCTRSAGR